MLKYYFFLIFQLPSMASDCIYEEPLSYIETVDSNKPICMGIKNCDRGRVVYYCDSLNDHCPTKEKCESQKTVNNIVPVKVQVKWGDSKPSSGALVFDDQTNLIVGETDSSGLALFDYYEGGKLRITQPNYAVKCENVVSVQENNSKIIDVNGNYVITTWWPFPGPLTTGDLN